VRLEVVRQPRRCRGSGWRIDDPNALGDERRGRTLGNGSVAPAPDGEGGNERGDQAGDGHTGRDDSASHVVVIARVREAPAA
jgi:hypothetical protein